MPDYSKCDFSKAVIYKLICKDPEIKEVYVGSTCNFKHRICEHKSHSKIKNLKVYNFINENGGWNNWKCDIIQHCPCSGLEELRILEQHYIETIGTLNNMGAVFDQKEYHKEWYELNKDKRDEQKRQYNKLNKDKIREQQRRYNKLNKDKLSENRILYCAKQKAEAEKKADNMRSILDNKNISKNYKMEHISEVHTLKMPELRELVRRYGLKRTSKLTKAQLVNVLVEHLESIVADPEPVKAEDVLELPTQELEEAVAELSVSEESPPEESPPRKIRKPRKRKTISDSD